MPDLSCGVQCSRTILVVLNVLFIFFGWTVLGVGIYVEFNGNFSTIAIAYSITQALGSAAMKWIGTAGIIAGIITTCLALFGCLGAAYKKRVFLYLYAIILTLIILLEFGTVIVALKFRNDVWVSYDSGFEQVFQDAYRNNQTKTIDVIEKLEQQFECCGVHSYLDYLLTPGHLIPKACYPNQKPIGLPFNKGCAAEISNWLLDQLPIIAAVLGSILFIEIFGVVSSLVLGVAISHSSPDGA